MTNGDIVCLAEPVTQSDAEQTGVEEMIAVKLYAQGKARVAARPLHLLLQRRQQLVE